MGCNENKSMRITRCTRHAPLSFHRKNYLYKGTAYAPGRYTHLKDRRTMERQDYLKKQIDQLGKVLGKILADLIGLKNQGKASEGIEIAAQELESELDLDIEELIEIPTDKLAETLITKYSMKNEHIDRFADILFELSEGFEFQDSNKKADYLYKKSLALYEYLNNTGTVYSFDRHFKIEKIKNLLNKV